jgi:hypothetical protein
MQPFSQKQLIYCLKGSVISRKKLDTKIKTNFFFELSFWSEIYKKCQKLYGHDVSQLCDFQHSTFVRVKKVIIANLVISLVPEINSGISNLINLKLSM